MTDPLNWREWLVRQLRDDCLSDKEVASILAWHPAITDEWRTPELGKLMEAAHVYARKEETKWTPVIRAALAFARAHQEDKG